MWIAFFKLFGAAMVVGCGWFVGNARALGLQRRRMLFEDLVTLCGVLERNLEGRRDPLPAFFQKDLAPALFSLLQFERTQNQPFEEWYADFWKNAEHGALLKQEELTRIGEFWTQLGADAGEEEMGKLRFFAQYFELLADQARDDEKQKTRLCRSLGICAGGVTALLLL